MSRGVQTLLALLLCSSAAGGAEPAPEQPAVTPGEASHLAQLVFAGRLDDASRHITDVVDRLADDPDGRFGSDYYIHVTGLLRYGKLEESIALARRTAERYPELPLVRITLLDVLWNLGRDAEVYDEEGYFFYLYNRKLLKDPDADPVALACVAHAVHRENPDSARKAYRNLAKVLALKPEFELAYFWLADLMISRYCWDHHASLMGGGPRTIGVESTLGELIKRNPLHTPARVMLIEYFLEHGKYDEALKEIDAVLAHAPTTPEAHALRAEIAYAEEDLAAAAASAVEALKHNPLHMRALALLAAVRIESGAGHEELDKVADVYGARKAQFYHMLARALARRRRFEQAVAFARKAVEQDRHYWQGYYEAGVNLLRMGEAEQCRKVLERSHRLNPFNIWSFNMLNMLDRLLSSEKMTVFSGDGFALRLPAAEKDVYSALLLETYETLMPEYERKYSMRVRGPDEHSGKLLVEILPDHSDFSVRSVGLPNLDALGVCFGRVVTMPSPRDMK
ncbi:MAG TPA: tetratricopeptide repeat protein, partial [Planctomycetes bacterium]|nr:tetratricopeptide repeat protein [Planctomycetota bacterium]